MQHFHLLAVYDAKPVTAIGTVDILPPVSWSKRRPVTLPKPLKVRLRESGMTVQAGRSAVPAECGDTTHGELQMPYGAPNLARCGAALKLADGLTSDLFLFASQDAELPFRAVAETMDALAMDFPRVSFGLLP